MKKYIAMAGILLVTLTSCFKEPEYPVTPAITFKSINSFYMPARGGDSIVTVISFQDGDGDLGISLNPNDTTAHNYLINVFKKQQGKYVPVIFRQAGFSLNGHIPRLNDLGKTAIEGELSYGIIFGYLFAGQYSPTIRPRDTLKFNIQVIDRAGHKSNIVETTDVVVGVNQ